MWDLLHCTGVRDQTLCAVGQRQVESSGLSATPGDGLARGWCSSSSLPIALTLGGRGK